MRRSNLWAAALALSVGVLTGVGAQEGDTAPVASPQPADPAPVASPQPVAEPQPADPAPVASPQPVVEEPVPAIPETGEGLVFKLLAPEGDVAVGGMLAVTAQLANTTDAPVRLPALTERAGALSFDVQLDDGPVSRFERIPTDGSEPELAVLAPGEAVTYTVNFPVLCTGSFKVTGYFGRPAAGAVSLGPQLTAQGLERGWVAAEGGATDVQVRILTTLGPIRARLFPRHALATCLNFARLAIEGRDSTDKTPPHFYDGLEFTRVLIDYLIQGGDPVGRSLRGSRTAGYYVPDEAAALAEPLPHLPGRLSMALTEERANTGGCQFAIMLRESQQLDGRNVVFGEVTEGLDVIYTIGEVPVRRGSTDLDGQRTLPEEPVVIELLRVEVAR